MLDSFTPFSEKIATSVSVKALLCASVLVLPVVAQAETMRCEGHIIEEGMTRDQVLEHCGPPEAENLVNENSWTYSRGSGNLKVHVFFYANGKVERIESGRD